MSEGKDINVSGKDLISRRAAIEAVEEITSSMSVCINLDECHGMKRMQKQVVAELTNIPSIRPEQRWIPCSERLPEEDTDVLVTVYFMGLEQRHKNGWNDHIKPKYYVEVASHVDGHWTSYSDEYKVARSRHKVIAWMPLPEPYKGGEDIVR